MSASSRLLEERIELAAGSCAGELVEFAVLDNRLGGTHESTPGGARKCTADADAAHAERGNILERQLAHRSDEKIDRLRRDRCHDGGDILARRDAWRIEAIGAGICIGLESLDGFVEVGAADKKALGASHQKRVAAGLVDG